MGRYRDIRDALGVALWYFLFSALWILLSDWLVRQLLAPAHFGTAQVVKGIVFVSATSVLVLVLSARQIRRWRQVSERLRREQELLERAEDLAHLGSWEWDPESDTVTWSRELFRITGRDPAAGAPPFAKHDRFFPAEDWSRLNEAVAACLRDGRPYEVEVRVLPEGDGDARHCVIRGRIHPGEYERPRRLFGTVQDITDRKRLEAERNRMSACLAEAQRLEAVGQLAGGIAHDFNNMLMVILGHAEIARRELAPGHPTRARIEEIHGAAERSARLTRQLLGFARRQVVHPRVIDLNSTIEQMLEMLRGLVGEEIRLCWEPTPELWPVRVDRSQIEQILTHLCLNACDAIRGPGTITIETSNVHVDERVAEADGELVVGDHVVLAVTDDGCGIDEETLDRVFEPFFTTKPMGQGTGLGLSTVYGIARQNRGFVRVHSQPSKGSRFEVHLRRHIHAEEENETAASRAREAEADDMAATHRGTVLLVEDEARVAELERQMLEKLGYTVLVALSPREAIDRAADAEGPIDLVVTDVMMPEMNGRELADRLKTVLPKVAVLFMSGHPEDVIAERGILPEGRSFIQKPFSIEELAARTREALQPTSGEKGPAKGTTHRPSFPPS